MYLCECPFVACTAVCPLRSCCIQSGVSAIALIILKRCGRYHLAFESVYTVSILLQAQSTFDGVYIVEFRNNLHAQEHRF